MKILLVNTFDRGGAANACIRLHKALRQRGVLSRLLFRRATKSIPETEVYDLTKADVTGLKNKFVARFRKVLTKGLLKRKRQRLLSLRPAGLELFSFPDSQYDITKSRGYKDADLINLHWVANFLDIPSFFSKNTKPVVWTLHDMNPFTGGEHYVECFLGMDSEGNPKARIPSALETELSRENLEIKSVAYQKAHNLHIVVLCEWMAGEVAKSKLFSNCPVHIIPNGLNSTVFKPEDKIACRRALNLDVDKKILLFVADSMEKQRKGFRYLMKAIQGFKDENILLCSVGHVSSQTIMHNNVIHMGTIKEEEKMRSIYNAADVFVIPSLMDNLPNTVLESLLCGTPVIGFPVGGIPDMIIHGENGILAEDISVKALERVIKDFLDGKYTFESGQIRADAVQKYDSNIQAKAYEILFGKILAQQSSSQNINLSDRT